MSEIFSLKQDECSLDDAISALQKHCKNKNKFSRKPTSIIVDGVNSCDYTNKSLRRTYASNTHFKYTVFSGSAAAGSIFYNCNFDHCKIENANFQECSFINSHLSCGLDSFNIIHSNFNETLFSENFLIKNNIFEHSVFYNTAFIDGCILNTTFNSCTLENATLTNVLLKNVRFTDLNIDYTTFEKVIMDRVILPFSQICYTFGLLPYLATTTDNVYITSQCTPGGIIAPNEYLTLIPCFEKYYKETQEYFPLANIYFYMGKTNEAKKVILEGIQKGVMSVDFRKIKYLCKLIYTYNVFSYHERYDIISYIYSRISFSNMHSSLLYNFTAYKNEIEGYLLRRNSPNIITAEINIITNISFSEEKKLGVALSVIEEIIELYKSDSMEHRIICHHGSPETFFLEIQDTLPTIVAIVGTLYGILVSHYTLQEKITSLQTAKLQRKLDLEKTQLEIANQKEQLINTRLDNQLKQTQLEQITLERADSQDKIKKQILQKNISENNVEIKEINHIIFGNIPVNLDSDIIQYRYINS